MHPLEIITDRLSTLKTKGLYRALKRTRNLQGPTLCLGHKEYLNFASNNYLGFCDHPELKAAAKRVFEEHGVGSGGSRLLSGNLEIHEKAEAVVAEFKEKEAGLIFNSGYHANIGVISALAQKGDGIFSDELNHASIVDGCRLSGGEISIYKHKNLEALEKLLKVNSSKRLKLIVTESVFSMDGDQAPLEGICELAARYDALLMVDEAHSTGIYGEKGAGLVSHQGLSRQVDIIMGTFGKALGLFGAYVCASAQIIDYLVNTARTFIYTTALPPILPALIIEAIALCQATDQRELLFANIGRLQAVFRRLGLNPPPDPSPIFPLMIGGAQKTMELSQRLFDAGIFAPGIRPPTVPENACRIRFSLMSLHTEAQIEQLYSQLKREL